VKDEKREGGAIMEQSRILIKASGLTKDYRLADKESGLRGAVKHLFAPKYKSRLAVDQIDLEIAEGEAVAYIGANGAGKSTTIKMLVGIIKPTAGSVEVCGLTPNKSRVQNAGNIGVMFGQKTQLWWDIPVKETFSLLRDIYEIPEGRYQKQLAFLTELLDMSSFMGQPARQLSLGQRVRADLAAAFLHDPKVLFLDEPTIGLDIMGKKAVRTFLREINQSLHKTILLTSHDLEDIHEVCEKVVIIDEGKIIYHGSIREMLSTYSTKKIMNVELEEKKRLVFEELRQKSEAIFSVSRRTDERVQVEYAPERLNTVQLLSLISEYGDVGEVSILDEGIEDIVEKLYRGKLGTGETS